jgi:MOSC domain-containing protein YiiM
MSERARVESVNVGAKRTVEWGGRMVETGIWKSPVEGPVSISGVNLAGDDQADRRVHGGPDKAVYAYSSADYQFWSDALGTDLEPGTFGENLTVHRSASAGGWEQRPWR